MVHLSYLCYIMNGLIKMPTDCPVDLIFMRVASQLYYFELKIFIWQNIFIWILTNGFIAQNMIKISYCAI